MFRTAMEAAKRNEEKRLALDILSRIPSAETLQLAASYVGESSLKDSAAGKAVRPGGMACQVGVWHDTMAVGVAHNMSVKLTEFPDAEGQQVYFRLPDLSVAAPDELAGD